MQEAAKVKDAGLAAGVITPPFKEGDSGTDWDDYAQQYGGTHALNALKSGITDAQNENRKAKYQKAAEELGILRSEKFSEFVKPKSGVSWLIDNWLPSEGTVMLFAPSGSGKSFVTLDMAFAVACEGITEWQGEKVLKHGAVVYFAGEGQLGMRKRCAGLAAARGIKAEDVNMYIISETLPLDDPDPKSGVERAIANIGMKSANVVMTIYDTTNCYMSGDENKTADATKYIQACKKLSNEFGCVVIIVNHTGLSQETQNRARGSSAFKAAMDVELKCTKQGSIITLEMTKSKDTELAREKKFRMERVDVPGYYDAYGRQETTCVLEDAFDIQEDTLSPESPPNEKPMSEAEAFARRTYSEAAKRYGEIEHDADGRDYVRVQTEDWRKVCYELSSSDNESSRRSAFSRVRKRLYEVLQILEREELSGMEYYSLKPVGDTYELEILTHLRNKKQVEE